jgi:hypothetical protein
MLYTLINHYVPPYMFTLKPISVSETKIYILRNSAHSSYLHVTHQHMSAVSYIVQSMHETRSMEKSHNLKMYSNYKSTLQSWHWKTSDKSVQNASRDVGTQRTPLQIQHNGQLLLSALCKYHWITYALSYKLSPICRWKRYDYMCYMPKCSPFFTSTLLCGLLCTRNTLRLSLLENQLIFDAIFQYIEHMCVRVSVCARARVCVCVLFVSLSTLINVCTYLLILLVKCMYFIIVVKHMHHAVVFLTYTYTFSILPIMYWWHNKLLSRIAYQKRL